MSGERGSALILAVLIMAVLTLLGVSYLLIGDTENKIAENERLSAQALYFAEGVTREVKRWFDRPPYTAAGDSNLDAPDDGGASTARGGSSIEDGPGPAPDVPADGSAAWPYYKLGQDLDRDGADDIFDKPVPQVAESTCSSGPTSGTRHRAWIERSAPRPPRFWTHCPRRSCRVSRRAARGSWRGSRRSTCTRRRTSTPAAAPGSATASRR